jgi:anti-sigma factor RsiW
MSRNEVMTMDTRDATPKELEQLSAYHDGELGGLSRWLFERRLTRSPELRRELAALEEIGGWVREAEPRADEVDLWDRIAMRLPAADAQRAEAAELKASGLPAWLGPLGAAAVVAAALVVVVFGSMNRTAPDQRVVRWMDSGGHSVMVLDDEADQNVTIIWVLEESAVEGAARGGRRDVA